jgi:hypothetical protein
MDGPILDSQGEEISEVRDASGGDLIAECIGRYWSIYMESQAPT